MPPASPPVTAAQRARLAHRVLRLKENGVDSQSQLASLAKSVASANADPTRPNFGPDGLILERDQRIVGSDVHPLAVLAFSVQHLLDADMDGPTDPELVKLLFGRSIRDIYASWDAAVVENVETEHPESVRRFREARQADYAQFEAKVARMESTGTAFNADPVFGHNREPNLANALYDNGREGFLEGQIDWDTAVIKAVLVDSADYTPNLGTHEFMSSVEAVPAAVEERSGAFTTKTVTAGVADADDITFTAAAGDPVDAIVIYQASAVTGGADVANTAQRLIAYIDTTSPAMPVTLNGGNVTVTWDSGTNRIFKL